MLNQVVTFISSVDWAAVATGITALIITLILQSLLDFKIAFIAVKYMSWVPVRSLFRENPPELCGEWEILWGDGGSQDFSSEIDRHGHAKLKQLGKYIYFEFYSKKVKYAFFGHIRSSYIIGEWFDIKDKNGYFGVYQFEIVNSGLLKGVWLGHSKKSREIRSDKFEFTKLNP